MSATLDHFLSPADSARVQRTLDKLAALRLDRLALTGGLAIELHLACAGRQSSFRNLSDIDFIAPAFDAIPQTLGRNLLFRHVHPADPPGKTLLQGVDSETKMRIDVFRAYGAEMERLERVEIAGLALQMVSLQDLAARHARLNWDLAENRAVAAKFARDFLRMLAAVRTDGLQEVWLEHRKPEMPESFEVASARLCEIIPSRPELLVDPAYSTNVHDVCERCRDLSAFPLADAGQILAILGYC